MQNVYYIFIKAKFVTYSLIASWDFCRSYLLSSLPLRRSIFLSPFICFYCLLLVFFFWFAWRLVDRLSPASVLNVSLSLQSQSQFEFAILAYRSRWSRAMLAVLIMLLLPGLALLCLHWPTSSYYAIPLLYSGVCPARWAGAGQGPVSCGMLTNCCRN